jgi:F-box-like
VKRIDILPDDVLLDIFDFYMNEYAILSVKWHAHAWPSLAHVCRRWRSLVFQSRCRLNLQLYCTPQTPAKDTLDDWPALPLTIHGSMDLTSGADNIIAALRKSNRVCNVELYLAGRQFEEVLAAMHVSFPELTNLRLSSHDENPPVIPDSFLDGSAPRLRNFSLNGIPFLGLPNLSATHLVSLNLSDIPHSGYISPEEMVAPLSVLSSLEILSLGFRSPQSHPDWESRSIPRLKCSILPALRRLHFKGVTEYLEELVTRIDTPQLDGMNITFFNQIDFACTRLAQFIDCTPKLRARDEAHVQLDDRTAGISLRNRTSNLSLRVYELLINISCREPDWQLSSIEQICNSLHLLSTPEDLYIEHGYSQLVWKSGAIEDILWSELLRPFAAVKNLYLSKEFAPGIAVALKELVGIAEVLPKLQNIFVEGLQPSGPLQENIGQFVAERRLSDHPIAISVSTWKEVRVNRRESRSRFPFAMQGLLPNNLRCVVRCRAVSHNNFCTIIHRFRILVVGKVRIMYHTGRKRNWCILHRSETLASPHSSKPFSKWICWFVPSYLRTPASPTYAPCKF